MNEQIFREEVMRGLKLGQINRNKPQASFLKFYRLFKEKYGPGSLHILEWKKVFFDVLIKTAVKTDLSSSQLRDSGSKPKLRLIPNIRRGAWAAEKRHPPDTY